MAAPALKMAALHRTDAPAPVLVVARTISLPVGATPEWAVARRVDTASLPFWQRPIYVLCHRIMGMPACIVTTRGTFDLRCEAEASCVDEHDYIFLQPHGAAWDLEPSSQELIGLCFPCSPQWAAANERDREYYRAMEGDRAALQRLELERAAEEIAAALAVEARARECLNSKQVVLDKLSKLDMRLTKLEELHPKGGHDHAHPSDST